MFSRNLILGYKTKFVKNLTNSCFNTYRQKFVSIGTYKYSFLNVFKICLEYFIKYTDVFAKLFK